MSSALSLSSKFSFNQGDNGQFFEKTYLYASDQYLKGDICTFFDPPKSKEQIDLVLQLANKIDSVVVQQDTYAAIANAYRELETEEGLEKAFDIIVIELKGQLSNLFCSKLIDTCLKVDTVKSLQLAVKIADKYPDLLFNVHKDTCEITKALENKEKKQTEELKMQKEIEGFKQIQKELDELEFKRQTIQELDEALNAVLQETNCEKSNLLLEKHEYYLIKDFLWKVINCDFARNPEALDVALKNALSGGELKDRFLHCLVEKFKKQNLLKAYEVAVHVEKDKLRREILCELDDLHIERNLRIDDDNVKEEEIEKSPDYKFEEEAKKYSNEYKFDDAYNEAQKIKNDLRRSKVLAQISKDCYLVKTPDALNVALKIALLSGEGKDCFLYRVVTEHMNQKNESQAYAIANTIENEEMRRNVLSELNVFFPI